MGGILQVVGGVVGALGQLQQSRTQAANYAAQAEAERMNAGLAAANADIARSDAKIRQGEAATEAHKVLGRQRAALAQGGMLYGATGSLLQSESERNAEDTQISIGRQGELEALNYKIQQQNALAGAATLKANAKAAKGGGWLGAAGSLLSGVAAGYDYKTKTGNWW
jgi:hypothetical protein